MWIHRGGIRGLEQLHAGNGAVWNIGERVRSISGANDYLLDACWRDVAARREQIAPYAGGGGFEICPA